MLWKIEFYEDQNYVKATFEGTYSLEDDLLAKTAQLADERWRAGMSTLVDFRQLTVEDINIDSLRKNVKFVAIRQYDFGFGRVACLVRTERGYAIIRQFMALMEFYTENRTMPFFDESEALNWLLEKNADESPSTAE